MIYKRWIEDWETRLCYRTNNRVVRPFEWGLDWSPEWPQTRAFPRNGYSEQEYFRILNQLILQDSPAFFDYEKPRDFRLKNDMVRFTSAVHTRHPENNVVHAQWHPARKHNGRAVLVLPHWNASFNQHGGLCRGLAKLGISALRLSLPYHDYRMPAELHRADYSVSSNIGRTIDATRQAVVDSRSAVDWLESQGYDRIGIVGTSLGSCYAFLASAHDRRMRVNVYNHCSSYFADVVWTGLSTEHIRQSMEENIQLEGLRECWSAISPVNYLDRYAEKPKKSKFIYTTYDTTFLPEFSRDILRQIKAQGIEHSVAVLPCGHYTLGESPYKFLVGWHICSFFKTKL
jgi:hypothetical protein